ncbi:MAG: peptidoglycan-binding protein [Firmicutes bacterium]|nr:peptidoglycan-binding protein [Bacillota bacterium]
MNSGKILKDRGKPYKYDADVEKVQFILENGGFSVGKSGIDGKYGKDTAKAVKAYQKTYGLKVDGIVGKETWGHMTAEQNTYDDVLGFQQLLNIFGYSCGAEDAIFGKKTKAACKKFQKQMGIAVDGKLGRETWNAILHMETRLITWGFIVTRWSVQQFIGAMGLNPKLCAGKNTLKKLNEKPIVSRFKESDMVCQCNKKYCDGYPAGRGKYYGVAIMAERIIRAAEKGGKIDAYIPSRKRKTKGGGIAGGYRCAKWNVDRKGAKSSQHLEGVAIDIACDNKADLKLLQKYAKKLNVYGGVGDEGANVVHVDLRGKKSRWKYN